MLTSIKTPGYPNNPRVVSVNPFTDANINNFPPPRMVHLIRDEAQTDHSVEISHWNPAEHRNDPERRALGDMHSLVGSVYTLRGIARYRNRYESRITLFAQGPSSLCKSDGYYYTDAYVASVSDLLCMVIFCPTIVTENF